MKRNLLLVAAACVAGCLALSISAPQAQFSNLTGSNRLEVWVEDSLRAASYLNQFDILYSKDAWNVGARLELDEEKWWDPERETELVRRFAEYHDDYLNLRFGNYYASFGRGLVLRAMEDQDVRVDRDIDGVYGNVSYKRLTAQAVAGRIRNDRNSSRADMLAGLDAQVEALQGLYLGAAYLRRDARNDATDEDLEKLGHPAIEECASGRINWIRGVLDFYLEGAQRLRRGDNDPRGGWTWTTAEDGHAWYGALTLGVPGYTIIVEGKDYLRFDTPYSTPPATNRLGQPVNDGVDERGGAATLTASPTADLTIEAGGSFAEARDELGERADTYGTVRKDWWGKGALKVGGEWIKEEEMGSHVLRERVGPTLECSYYLTDQTSLSFHGSFFAWDNHYRGEEAQDYTEITADISLSLGYSRAITFAIIKASEKVAEYDFDDQWMSVQLSWAFGYNHDLKIKFGQERGGIVCSGGICIYESPFEGVRVEMTSRL